MPEPCVLLDGSLQCAVGVLVDVLNLIIQCSFSAPVQTPSCSTTQSFYLAEISITKVVDSS